MVSVHKTYVFRIDRKDGEPWVARSFPPARPRARVQGDAAILRFLEHHDLLAALALLDAVDTKVATAERERFDLLHAPDHAVLTEQGPVAINWKASGRGPRLADFAYRHIEPTDDELERLEAVMYIRTLYLVCFAYRRAVDDGVKFREWGFIRPPEYFSGTAAATRAEFRR